MSENFYRRMFLIAAFWNVAGGAFIVVFANWIFATANLPLPEPPAYFHSWIALFVVFGIGYYMVYRDMYRNTNIVLLGILGKLAFSVIFIASMVMFRGRIPPFFLLPVVGDLVFVVLFGRFLSFAKRRVG